VVADDLTGAADTALAFWEHGLDAAILLGPLAPRPAPLRAVSDARVVAVDTATRSLPPAAASRAVAATVAALRRGGVTRFYKKIDSTLRGNCGAEIEAMLAACEASVAVVCPAFPAQGRTVVGGRVRVCGQDLMAAPIAVDPHGGAASSRVAEALGRQTRLPIAEVRRPDELGQPVRRGIVVVDAATDADLTRWVDRVGLDSDVLWVGSAGLAGALARATAWRTAPARRLPAAWATSGVWHPVVVVVGSLHAVSRGQMAALLTLPGATLVSCHPAGIVRGQASIDKVVERCVGIVREGGHCVLSTSASEEARRALAELWCEAGHEPGWAGERIAAWLGAVTAAVIQAEMGLERVICTGGDTARAALFHLGAPGLTVVGAVAPGVPIGRTTDRRLYVVTKAGGFGGQDTLARAVTLLQGDREE